MCRRQWVGQRGRDIGVDVAVRLATWARAAQRAGQARAHWQTTVACVFET